MKELLLNLPIFAGLDDDALEMLLAEACEIRVRAGGVVVKEGDPGCEMYLIAAGTARICKGHDSDWEVEIVRLGAMDFFGEMCILETLGRSATVQAVEDCLLWYSLKSAAFHRLYLRFPSQHGILVVNLARDLSRRLRRMDEIFAALM